MKDFYILFSKDIKDVHYSKKTDSKGKPFKRYSFKNIEEKNGTLEDYFSADMFFNISKLMIYQKNFDTIEDFLEKEKEVLLKTFEKDDANKRIKNMNEHIKFCLKNEIIEFIPKDFYKNKGFLSDFYIRTNISPIDELSMIHHVSVYNTLFVYQLKEENNQIIKEKFDVANLEEYLFFISLKEKNLLNSFNLFNLFIENIYGENELKYKERKYSELYFEFLIKHFEKYNLYKKY